MARSRSRSGGRKTTIEILDRTLADLVGDLEELGEQAFERMWRGTLTDVAEDANTRLARVFETKIEGGCQTALERGSDSQLMQFGGGNGGFRWGSLPCRVAFRSQPSFQPVLASIIRSSREAS